MESESTADINGRLFQSSTHMMLLVSKFFFFNTPPTTEIYTLSLHDALPISKQEALAAFGSDTVYLEKYLARPRHVEIQVRSEEHTSELQSRRDLVCRLLLEKKKKKSFHAYVVNIR